MTILQLSFMFFIVTNPIGNTPMLLAILKGYSLKDQRRILIREGFFSFLIAIFFQYFGEFFLSLLNIYDYAMSLCGGILLMILAIEMIFPHQEAQNNQKQKLEPFIVPIATPLLSGAGVLSLIMLFSKQEANNLKISLAIILAWAAVIAILAIAPYLQKIFGKRGLLALEQLMGMLLAIIATTVFLNGVTLYMETI